MPTTEWIDYAERLSRVDAYIYDHLDEDLTLERLAKIAFLSPYHFHRIYRASRGETIATTVRRMRLHRAAEDLARTSLKIEEISKRACYQTVQSFTRSFSESYGMPPARFRSHGSHTHYQESHPKRNLSVYQVTIKPIPEIEVVSMPNIGSYDQIGKCYVALYGWLGARQLIDPHRRVMTVYYDDPANVLEAQLRSRACATVSKPCKLEAPFERLTVAGGEYAVLRHKGSYAGLSAAYQWLFGTWLLRSGRALRDAPVIDEYNNSPINTQPEELLTDICVPLA